MKRSEKVGECGCQLVRDGMGLRMIDCPLHKKALLDMITNNRLHGPEVYRASDAIKKAEKGE